MNTNDTNNKIRVLMLSRDPKILDENSEVFSRMKEYAHLAEELYIVVFSKNIDSRAESRDCDNLHIYPAKSLLDMYRIGKKIIHNSRFMIHDSVITAQDPFETGLVGYWLKKKFKIPLQLQAHTDFLSPYFFKESLKNKIRVLLARFLIKRADRLRVVSERIRNSIIENCKLKNSCLPAGRENSAIEVRPIFVDTEKIKRSPIKTDLRKKYPDHDFIVLMASRLTREKNISLAIEAFAGIMNQELGIKNPLLLIVGEGPEYDNLKFKIKNLKLENSVAIEPWTDDLASYYKTADLFLLTSNYEGYGRTVIEAQAAGLPILMTDVGVAIGEVVPVGDKAALVAALNKIMDNSTT